jgi:hypothetical protein
MIFAFAKLKMYKKLSNKRLSTPQIFKINTYLQPQILDLGVKIIH